MSSGPGRVVAVAGMFAVHKAGLFDLAPYAGSHAELVFDTHMVTAVLSRCFLRGLVDGRADALVGPSRRPSEHSQPSGGRPRPFTATPPHDGISRLHGPTAPRSHRLRECSSIS